MFFQGSLQEGINTALQESKLVVCFVTDGESESQTWETEFLTDEDVKPALESQAVALRLQAGSQEAGFLEALFPVPRKPTVVIIHNGQLREYIAAGTSKEEFLRRARAALSPPPNQNQQQQQQAGGSTSTGQTLQATQVAPAPPAAVHGEDNNDASSSSAPQDARARQVQAALAERAKRLEADKKAKEAAARKEAEARAKARKDIDENSSGGSGTTNLNPAERKYADELRQRKQQAAEERRRILRRIEDDRRERKEREAQDRQARLLAQAQADPSATPQATASPSVPSPSSPTTSSSRQRQQQRKHEHCNLQVRLFSGSTMRARFPASASLATDVRPWIDRARRDNDNTGDEDGDAPYTFRVVLTPLPNRAIAAAEESEPLESLGLAPSATLVLVPVPRFASAYGRGGRGNPVWRALVAVVGLLAGIWGVIVRFLVGGGRRQRRGGEGGNRSTGGEDIEMDDLPPSSSAAGSRSRIRGFENEEDRKKRRDAQLYNGNSLNFEPRRDEDDDDGNAESR